MNPVWLCPSDRCVTVRCDSTPLAAAREARGDEMTLARSGVALAMALGLAACGLRDQADPNAVSVRGVQPTLEQMNLTANGSTQVTLVGNLATLAGYNVKDLGPGDQRWSEVFEAGVYEVGRQCDQYLDALFRFNREQRANRQGLMAAASASGAIMGLAGVTTVAIAITAAAFGLTASLFDAGVNSVLFTIEPSALRTVVLKGRQAYLDKLVRDKVQINSRPRMMIALQGYLAQCSPAAIEANINNAASGGLSVSSPLKDDAEQAAGLAAPALVTLKRAQQITGGAVQERSQPVTLPTGAAESERNLPSPELKAAQKALGIPDDGRYGSTTRDAIMEFQRGMYRRFPGLWPGPQVSGTLSDRTGRTLPTLGPMPPVFRSPFERAYLGNDGGMFTGDPLSTVDVGRLDQTLVLLGVPPDRAGAAATPDAKLTLMRDRIAELRRSLNMPSAKGPVLDSELFRAVWKTSPLNVDGTD